MWPELKEQIAVEQAEIRDLVAFHHELLGKCRRQKPAGIELSALGAFLHSLYSGIENLFRRVAIELDGRLPEGADWHRQLLREMAGATGRRPRVISEDLHDLLIQYLEFRHLFRNLYAFRLQWERMEALVLGAEGLVTALEGELAEFAKKMEL